MAAFMHAAVTYNKYAGTRGGGVGIIYKSSIDLRIFSSSRDTDIATFEHMSCNSVINSYSCIALPSQQNELTTNYFLEEEWPIFFRFGHRR